MPLPCIPGPGYPRASARALRGTDASTAQCDTGEPASPSSSSVCSPGHRHRLLSCWRALRLLPPPAPSARGSRLDRGASPPGRDHRTTRPGAAPACAGATARRDPWGQTARRTVLALAPARDGDTAWRATRGATPLVHQASGLLSQPHPPACVSAHSPLAAPAATPTRRLVLLTPPHDGTSTTARRLFAHDGYGTDPWGTSWRGSLVRR